MDLSAIYRIFLIPKNGTLDVTDKSSGDGINLPNEAACNVNSDCYSNICDKNICIGKSGDQGFPWWGWLIIAITIIIIIIVIIFIFSSSKKKDNIPEQNID